jgi:predicted DNA-binding protein
VANLDTRQRARVCGTSYAIGYGIVDGMEARRKNFHVPLGEDVYKQLKDAAERSGKAATEFAREAIEAALIERRKAELDESIAQYAAELAGTTDDLDPDLERAAIEHLVKPTRRRR